MSEYRYYRSDGHSVEDITECTELFYNDKLAEHDKQIRADERAKVVDKIESMILRLMTCGDGKKKSLEVLLHTCEQIVKEQSNGVE